MPKVSILCPTMRVGGIDLLLHSLSRQTMEDFELILCDALWPYRHELVREKAEEYGVSVIHVEPRESRFPVCSYCRHMNTALVHAQGEIALLIVDYTWLPEDIVARHVNFHSCHEPSHGLMGPHRYTKLPPLSPDFKSYGRDDTLQYAEDVKSGGLDSVMFSIFQDQFSQDAQALEEDDYCRDPKLRLPAGMTNENFFCKNESVRMEHLLTLNGFDEELDGSHGWQDSDIADRLVKFCGVSFHLDPTMIVQIVNPRSVFPYGVRQRPVEANEQIWLRKRNAGFPDPVNSWSIREAREVLARKDP